MKSYYTSEPFATMKIIFALLAAVIVLVSVSQSFAQQAPILRPARGWYKRGTQPDSYEMGVSDSVKHNGKPSACISSIAGAPQGNGDLYQECLPGQYEGKSVRLTAWIKTIDVRAHAYLWLRVLDTAQTTALAFDGMQDRTISGTTEWKKCEIVLDVPKGSGVMRYGVELVGPGTVYFSEVNFEILGPATGNVGRIAVPKAPTNLDFEN